METSQPSLPASPEAPRVSGLALRGFALPRGIPGRLGGFIMARGGQAAAGEITGLLDIRAGDQVLEVGYGPGVLLRQLAGHTRVGRVTGVDPSPVMRDMARRRCKAAIAAGRADPRLGTAARTGLPDAAFDHVVSVNNVLFWDSIPAGLAELRRVLRPAGSVAIAFHSRTSPSRHERRIGLSEHDAARIHAAMSDVFGTAARHDLGHLTAFTASPAGRGGQRYEVRPVAWVESPLKQRAQAPRQGSEGAPEAWLAVEPDFAKGIRDLRAGKQVILLTWLDRARRDELAAVPRGDPASPSVGVFSTRSPDRPNPVGLHRTRILAVEGLRIRVSELEALDGTPVIDIKPVIGPVAER